MKKHMRGNLYSLRLCTLIIAISTFSVQSCTTTRLVNNPALRDCPADSKNLCHTETRWIYFWGLGNDKEIIADCETPNITQVEYKSNYLFTVISFLTLDIIHPQKVEWNCGVPDEDPDEI